MEREIDRDRVRARNHRIEKKRKKKQHKTSIDRKKIYPHTHIPPIRAFPQPAFQSDSGTVAFMRINIKLQFNAPIHNIEKHYLYKIYSKSIACIDSLF